MKIDSIYGTHDDFTAFLKKAKSLKIKVMMDLVVNHTSDEHAWFKDAKSSKKSKYRDFYIFHDGKNGGPPNDWESIFGGSAWTYNE